MYRRVLASLILSCLLLSTGCGLGKMAVKNALRKSKGSSEEKKMAEEIKLYEAVTSALEKKDYAAAVNAATKLIEKFPDASSYILRAQAYSLSKQYAKALPDFNKAIELEKDESAFVTHRGECYWAMGNMTSAKSDYEKALKMDGESEDVLNAYAWFLSTCDDKAFRDGKRAVTMAKKACELTHNQESHIMDTLACAYAEVGDFENAATWINMALKQAKQDGSDADAIKETQDHASSIQKKQAIREKFKK